MQHRADTSEKHKEIQNKAQFKKEASSSLNFGIQILFYNEKKLSYSHNQHSFR